MYLKCLFRKYTHDVLPARPGGGRAHRASIKLSSNTAYSSRSISFKSRKCLIVRGHRFLAFMHDKGGVVVARENFITQSGSISVHMFLPHSSITCLWYLALAAPLQIPQTTTKKNNIPISLFVRGGDVRSTGVQMQDNIK